MSFRPIMREVFHRVNPVEMWAETQLRVQDSEDNAARRNKAAQSLARLPLHAIGSVACESLLSLDRGDVYTSSLPYAGLALFMTMWGDYARAFYNTLIPHQFETASCSQVIPLPDLPPQV